MTVYSVITKPRSVPYCYGHVARRGFRGKLVPWQEKFLFRDEASATAEAERLSETGGSFVAFPLTVHPEGETETGRTTVYAVIACPSPSPKGFGYVALKRADGTLVPWQERFLFSREEDAAAEAERLIKLKRAPKKYYKVFPVNVF